MRPYECLVFDLDDTLFDTWGQLVTVALKEACQKMIQAGLKADINSAVDYRKQLYSINPRCDFWTELAAKFGSSSDLSVEQLAKIGDRAFHNRNINEDISLFPGVAEMLNELHHTFKMYLVTAGNFNTQSQKIKILDVELYFDNIYCVDPSQGQTKKQAFQKILKLTEYQPKQVLSIGNRLDQEIRMAKELGMETCYVRYGEYVNMKPSDNFERPDFTIELIANLPHILEMNSEDLNELRSSNIL